MKKGLTILGLLIFVTTSCKKDYTCACSSSGQVVSSSTINDTKGKAETACNANDGTFFGFTVDCSIQ
jgi:hypothetical protein